MTEQTIETSDRGFMHGEPIPGNYGGQISAYESSGMTPAIWINVEHPGYPNSPDPEPTEATVLLGLEKATQLRDQLDYLIKNHFTIELYGDNVEED